MSWKFKRSSFFYRFRYDGIIDSEVTSEGLLPINRDQVETSKYSLQWDLYSGSASDFPEDALTQKEKVRVQYFSLCNIYRYDYHLNIK